MTAQHLRLLKPPQTPAPERPRSLLSEDDMRALLKQQLCIRTRYIELMAEAARLRDERPARPVIVEVPPFRPVLVPAGATPPSPLWRPVSNAKLPNLLRLVRLIREPKLRWHPGRA